MNRNDPTLFIDSVTKISEESSNQESFDSRIPNQKRLAFHRIDDIKAMLAYGINVIIEITTNKHTLEGKVVSVSKTKIHLENEEVLLSDIVELNILHI